MNLSPIAAKALAAYCKQVATLNGAPSDAESFAVSPSVAQTLESRVREQDEFLRLIPAPKLRDQMVGEVVGLRLSGSIANRTAGTRRPRPATETDGRRYECKPSFFDTAIPYAHLDEWAKFPDFQAMMRSAVIAAIANDRQMIGFHGTHAAAETNSVANPMLQDMGRGWLQYMREEAPENVMSGIRIGPGGRYETLDEAVNDAKRTLIDKRFRKAVDLRCLVDTDMMTGKQNALLRAASAVEKEASVRLLENDGLANVKGLEPSNFPANTIMISPLSNFAIYTFERGYHRTIRNEPDVGQGQISDYINVVQDYVIEEPRACAVIENILLPDGNGNWINADGEIVP